MFSVRPRWVLLGSVNKNITMPEIRGILFDKDGTLIDFNRTWLTVFQRAAEYLHTRFGESADPNALLKSGGYIAESKTWQPDSLLVGGCNQEIIALWTDMIGQPIEGDALQSLEAIFTRPADAFVPVVDDLNSLLIELRELGIKLGVATMDNEANAHHLLGAMGVDALFDFVCGADSGYGIKPQAGMVEAFCRHCELQNNQVMMVGDSPNDMNMGKNAGVALTVGVCGAYDAKVLAPYADKVIENISGIQSIILT